MQKPVFMLLLVLCCSFQNVSGPDLVVMKAAESQLPAYVDKIQPGKEGVFGFTPDDDLDACKAGKPYRMLLFNSDFYKNKLDEEKNYLVIKNEWRVPVTIQDTNRSLLTMEGNPGNYIISDMGAPLLARELQQKTTETGENDVFYLLQVTPLLADFIVIEHDNSFAEARFIPLASAIQAIPGFGKKDKPSYTLTETERMVKEALLTAKPIPQAAPAKEKTKKPGSK